jgi:L-ascorbate metabolism protein UlaG (beta-lactamase superfamily)
VLSKADLAVYVDPVGGAEAFKGLKKPDIIIITHIHGDHLSVETLNALDTQNATILAPQSVADKLPDTYSNKLQVLANGQSADLSGISIKAIAMYNLPPSEDAHHPKGRGNGYVISDDTGKIYISGDTEGTPEMRSLKNIDVAFVCMNLPYTMDVQQAADAVLDFKPAIVYPYHHRGQDIETFKKIVNTQNDDIDVRLLNWYK